MELNTQKLREISGSPQLTLGMVGEVIIALPALLDAYDRQQWIPCAERLPEVDGYYLAYGKFYEDPDNTGSWDVYEAYYTAEEGWEWQAEYGLAATHWMPLPAPPKGDEA